MICEMREAVHCWEYEHLRCEKNSLNGIRQILAMNSSHPIQEGISLVYFIRKPKRNRHFADHRTICGDPLFGSKQVQWSYHCCLGFRDLYLGSDWFIDLSYHCMVHHMHKHRMVRMISKEQYLPNIPSSVNIYVIPLKNLEYFVNTIRFKMPLENLNEYLELKEDRICFKWVFEKPIHHIPTMLNQSIIFKIDPTKNWRLPGTLSETKKKRVIV